MTRHGPSYPIRAVAVSVIVPGVAVGVVLGAVLGVIVGVILGVIVMLCIASAFIRLAPSSEMLVARVATREVRRSRKGRQ